MNSYATDGVCHNAEPGTYGHECGKPAVWVGTSPGGFRSGFCQRCRDTGYEARSFTDWTPIEPPSRFVVRRAYGNHNADWLTGWDIIWGPVWCGSPRRALRFATPQAADEARLTALQCCKPVPWRVPDFGGDAAYRIDTIIG